MKIALVVPHLYPEFGGHEYYLARELERGGQDVCVFTSDLQPTRYFKKTMRISANQDKDEIFEIRRIHTIGEVHGVPIFNPSSALRKYRPNVIHAQEYFQFCSMASFYAARRLNVPFVFTQHKYYYPRGIWSAFWSFMDNSFGNMIKKRATQITAISSAAKRFLISTGVPGNRIKVIPLGVDTSEFTPISGIHLRKKLGLLNKTVILFVGRLTQVKGVEFLITAFNRVHKAFPNTKLVILGRGELKQNLIELSEKLQIKNSVIFLDFIERAEMPQLYAASDIFVLPSFKEPFGLVLLEAMAMEKPIIGTRTGGIPDVITNGVNGFLIEPGNIDELSFRLAELVDNPELRAKMGKQGREIAIKMFDYQVIAKKTLEIYQCLKMFKER